MPRFVDIFGQDAAVARLQSAYRQDHLPHGLVFAGPEGVGKGTTAAALAMLFLCERPGDAEACGQCDSCRLFPAGTHPDYHRVYKEMIRLYDKTGKSKGVDLGIDVIRNAVIAPASMKAMMNRGKVFVIEQADLMTRDAANSLLKTLEEPQGRTLIILLTDQPFALLATIRSRCQVFQFSPLPVALVTQQLCQRGYAPEVAADAAVLSQGSLGNSLRWLQDGVIDKARELRMAMESAVIHRRPFTALPEWFEAAAADFAEKQVERDPLGSEDQAKRAGLALYLRLAADVLRGHLATLTDSNQMQFVCDTIERLAKTEMYLDGNVNVKLALSDLMLEINQSLK